MLQTTKAEITVDGVRISSFRENYFSSAGVSEELLDRSLENRYERDLMMLAEGDLFVEERGGLSTKDLAPLGGLLNYAQAITHRLMSTRGYHPGDSQFGVPWTLFLGQTYTSKSAVSSRLVAEITEELMKDHRTQEVLYVNTEFTSPTSIHVECRVVPIFEPARAIEVALSMERM